MQLAYRYAVRKSSPGALEEVNQIACSFRKFLELRQRWKQSLPSWSRPNQGPNLVNEPRPDHRTCPWRWILPAENNLVFEKCNIIRFAPQLPYLQQGIYDFSTRFRRLLPNATSWVNKLALPPCHCRGGYVQAQTVFPRENQESEAQRNNILLRKFSRRLVVSVRNRLLIFSKPLKMFPSAYCCTLD